ncbi:MAG: thioredoxin family protein [Verrucomicrobiota bacterium]|nr:thioredoxin family protein [Verrucomicrobiota bacterium]
MQRILLALIALFVSASLSHAELNWLTDFNAAKSKAKGDHKLVMLDFTGSDWCGWCKRLHAEVFSKPEFQEYAAKNLVLVELDFPRAKPQSDAVKKQNQELAGQFNIEGFPTLIILDSEGKKVGELGYMEGGPTAFIAELEKLRKS